MDYQEYLDTYVAYDKILAKRCWAAILDYLFYFIILMLYGYFLGEVHEWGFKEEGGFAFNVDAGFFATVFIWFLYFPVIESSLGYTLGKGLLDLKVVPEDKKEFPFIVSLKRHLLDPIDFAFFGIVAVLLVKYNKRHKRLGDYWAKSNVIVEE